MHVHRAVLLIGIMILSVVTARIKYLVSTMQQFGGPATAV